MQSYDVKRRPGYIQGHGDVCDTCSLSSTAKPDSSIAIADAPEGKRGLHELAWIIPVVCVLSAMVIIALLAIGQIGKRLRRPRPIADPQPQYEIVGGKSNNTVNIWFSCMTD